MRKKRIDVTLEGGVKTLVRMKGLRDDKKLPLRPEEMMQFNVVVRMPPVRSYTVKVKVKSIKKAEPRIVEP